MRVITPATSANLGPGFDTLGLALNIYNEFDIELSDKLIIESDYKNFNNKNNLIYKSFKYLANKFNKKANIKIRYNKTNIPFCRGLGSSASLIVSGVFACNELLKLNLNINELFDICCQIEGHPDNISPCIFGGLTLSYKDSFLNKIEYKYYKLPFNKNIYITIIIPNYEIETEKARKILRKAISIDDAIFNITNSMLLIKAFEKADFNLIKKSIEDKLHVPYRKKLIKDYDKIHNLCIKNGAYGFTISGSGSTLIIFSNDKNLSKKIKLNKNYIIKDVKVDTKGVKIKK